jgi:hypothetical protein
MTNAPPTPRPTPDQRPTNGGDQLSPIPPDRWSRSVGAYGPLDRSRSHDECEWKAVPTRIRSRRIFRAPSSRRSPGFMPAHEAPSATTLRQSVDHAGAFGTYSGSQQQPRRLPLQTPYRESIRGYIACSCRPGLQTNYKLYQMISAERLVSVDQVIDIRTTQGQRWVGLGPADWPEW